MLAAAVGAVRVTNPSVSSVVIVEALCFDCHFSYLAAVRAMVGAMSFYHNL